MGFSSVLSVSVIFTGSTPSNEIHSGKWKVLKRCPEGDFCHSAVSFDLSALHLVKDYHLRLPAVESLGQLYTATLTIF